MDIFLYTGDSPLTITPGDTTLHIRVSRNMDTSQPTPLPAVPGSVPLTKQRRRFAMIGLGVLAMMSAGLYSQMRASPASVASSNQSDLLLSGPPEFPLRPIPRQQALPHPQQTVAPTQYAPSPLNQAFGLH